jgi:hypothetical protein
MKLIANPTVQIQVYSIGAGTRLFFSVLQELIVTIGYNGRDDQCWCDITLGSTEELEDVWILTPYSSTAKIVGKYSTPSVDVTLFGPGGKTLSETVTSSWNGQPFMALIRID